MTYQVRTIFCDRQEPVARFEDRGLAAAMYARDLKTMVAKEPTKRGSHIVEVRYINVMDDSRFDEQTVLVTTSGRIPCQHQPGADH